MEWHKLDAISTYLLYLLYASQELCIQCSKWFLSSISAKQYITADKQSTATLMFRITVSTLMS